MMRDEREVRNEITAAGEMGMRPKPSTNSGQRLPSPFMGLEGEVSKFVFLAKMAAARGCGVDERSPPSEIRYK